jgi:WD40 repeat protein
MLRQVQQLVSLWKATPIWSTLQFSPDGTQIVSGSADHTIRIWNAQTGAPVGQPLEGHTNTVESVQFSPDAT